MEGEPRFLDGFYTEWRALATVRRDSAGPRFWPEHTGAGYNRRMEIDKPSPDSTGAGHFKRGAGPVISLLCLAISLSACQIAPSGPLPASSQEIQSNPLPTATFFPAVETLAPIDGASGTTAETTEIPSPTVTPFFTATPLPFGACADGLSFVGDLTYPDRTKVAPGQPLEKRWKVRNSGQCDWGPEYRFRWTGGIRLTTQDEFALYPAAAGSEAVIVIPMIAPAAVGEYTSDWRAVSPLGVPFGDALYINIIVAE
jgi:hypothetical protein